MYSLLGTKQNLSPILLSLCLLFHKNDIKGCKPIKQYHYDNKSKNSFSKMGKVN